MAMKHSLSDLNDYLFDMLDEITNYDLSEEQLEKAIRKSEAVANVAEKIIHTGELAVKTMKIMADAGSEPYVPDMLKIKGGTDE